LEWGQACKIIDIRGWTERQCDDSLPVL
jgi:hypothetical protein